MAGRLVIGILCLMLGLVLIAVDHRARPQTSQMESAPAVHWLTVKLQPIESFERVHVPTTRNGRNISLEHDAYVADLSFVTKDGKTIKVHKPIPDYIVRVDVPLAIDYREDDPYQTSSPHVLGLDTHGNKVDNDGQSLQSDSKPEAAADKQSHSAATLIGLCLVFLGGAMVYSAFKSD